MKDVFPPAPSPEENLRRAEEIGREAAGSSTSYFEELDASAQQCAMARVGRAAPVIPPEALAAAKS